LQSAVEHLRAQLAEPATASLHGLYISDKEVDGLLATADGSEDVQPERLVPARLSRLAQMFALDELEQQVLLICLAPELDRRYERLYGYLQDDMTRRRSSVDLVLRLVGRDASEVLRCAGPSGALARRGLLAGIADDAPDAASFASTALRIDPRITEYLLGADGLDRRLESWATLVGPSPRRSAVDAAHAAELEYLSKQFPTPGDWTRQGPIVYLHGCDWAAKSRFAGAWADVVGTRLLLVDIGAWVATLTTPLTARPFITLIREALLHDAVLVLRGVGAVLEQRAEARHQLTLLRNALNDYPKLTFLIGDSRWEPATWWTERLSLRIELAGLTAAARTRLWAEYLDDRFPSDAASELGTRYRFVEDADMRAVVRGALGRASLQRSDRVLMGDVLDSARAVSSPPLGGLARRLEPHFVWEDIVLPTDTMQRLRELCARIRHRATVYETWGYDTGGISRQGLAVLFAGLPGTGKTMAAEIVAADLGYDLYRIDLSAVVSKYIGETEKNLESIFRAAEQGEVVLLFDEADALFGKRSEVRDAHDRYANVEVAYLLQRLETYAGVAILTSNLSGNLDEAFTRRLDFVVEFRLPEEDERREIWRRSLPSGAPLAPDVDIVELARAFKLAGGHIRNAGLSAAFLAADDGEPISRRHMLHAIRREYEKLGKLVSELQPLSVS
jgi:hypothetical protein